MDIISVSAEQRLRLATVPCSWDWVRWLGSWLLLAEAYLSSDCVLALSYILTSGALEPACHLGTGGRVAMTCFHGHPATP